MRPLAASGPGSGSQAGSNVCSIARTRMLHARALAYRCTRAHTRRCTRAHVLRVTCTAYRTSRAQTRVTRMSAGILARSACVHRERTHDERWTVMVTGTCSAGCGRRVRLTRVLAERGGACVRCAPLPGERARISTARTSDAWKWTDDDALTVWGRAGTYTGARGRSFGYVWNARRAAYDYIPVGITTRIPRHGHVRLAWRAPTRRASTLRVGTLSDSRNARVRALA